MMTTSNGGGEAPRGPLELSEMLTIQTGDGATLPFEVVGLLEDPEDGAAYAVLRHEPDDGDERFIVTDRDGNLLTDEGLAQEILDDFLAFADDDEERGARNGELS
jgi:hypothetical protein